MYEIDHTHIYEWVRVINDVQSLVHMDSKSSKLSTNGDQKEDEHLLDREAIHCTIYGSRLSRWLVHLFPDTKTKKKVCAYFSVSA